MNFTIEKEKAVILTNKEELRRELHALFFVLPTKPYCRDIEHLRNLSLNLFWSLHHLALKDMVAHNNIIEWKKNTDGRFYIEVGQAMESLLQEMLYNN